MVLNEQQTWLLKRDILSVATNLHLHEQDAFEDPNKAAKVISDAVRELLAIAYETLKEA